MLILAVVLAAVADAAPAPASTVQDPVCVSEQTTDTLYHAAGCADSRAIACSGHGMKPRSMPRTDAEAQGLKPHEFCISPRSGAPQALSSVATSPQAPAHPQAGSDSSPAPSARSTRPTATRSSSVQCTGTTQKGARCRRMVASGGSRCYQH